MNVIRRFMCWWLGHTFKARSVENFSGGIMSLLGGSSCARCGKPFEDAYNDNDGGSYR
jgi:hypothetical protein